jgi:NADH-quinone oxidoreductase subunit A
MSSTAIVAYLLLFSGTALALVFIALWVGRFLRPHDPHPAKLEPYECGEPAVGSAFLQFDLRFYVVALVFIIFEVEVAFFFPWADVFGKLSQLANPAVSAEQAEAVAQQLVPLAVRPLAADGTSLPVELPPGSLQSLARAAMVDIAVFFGVLMVGFAYLWRRGDLNWVRAARSTALPLSPRTQRQGEPLA